jgi:hypothetical protein
MVDGPADQLTKATLNKLSHVVWNVIPWVVRVDAVKVIKAIWIACTTGALLAALAVPFVTLLATLALVTILFVALAVLRRLVTLLALSLLARLLALLFVRRAIAMDRALAALLFSVTLDEHVVDF